LHNPGTGPRSKGLSWHARCRRLPSFRPRLGCQRWGLWRSRDRRRWAFLIPRDETGRVRVQWAHVHVARTVPHVNRVTQERIYYLFSLRHFPSLCDRQNRAYLRRVLVSGRGKVCVGSIFSTEESLSRRKPSDRTHLSPAFAGEFKHTKAGARAHSIWNARRQAQYHRRRRKRSKRGKWIEKLRT